MDTYAKMLNSESEKAEEYLNIRDELKVYEINILLYAGRDKSHL